MTVSFPEPRPPGQQNNYGSGPFVAGHNFGNIEMVDDRTKAALAKISKDLPPVGALLRKALDEGLIPPETVRALASVAGTLNADIAHAIWEGGRHLNEDVAHAIWEGGRNINEDVALWLAEAGRNINETVANRFTNAAEELSRAADRFDRILQQMATASGTLRTSKANANEWSQTAAAMKRAADDLAMATQVHAQTQDRFSAKWFGYGIITGFATAIAFAILIIVIQVNAT